MKIQFFGATEEVTGSKHLITLKNDCQILLDCGMFQGKGSESSVKNRHFGFDPAAVNFLFLSHAHIDHSGLIPFLVKQGFRGRIYCTHASMDLCRIMLADSAHIQESEIEYINRKRREEGKKELKALYTQEDVAACWQYFSPLPYDQLVEVNENISVEFTDAGHILGSAVVNLILRDNDQTHRLSFTGDVGRYINKVLKRPQAFPQADTIICESTYGDRLHESLKIAKERLQQVVHETCVLNKGKLVIPAFSIGKTQELVFTLNKLGINKGENPIKVFVDSPLAIDATEIMRQHPKSFGISTRAFMKEGADPFGFKQLYYVRDVEMSKQINSLEEPCIIISASGMADAGRVKHHLANTIENERNAILIIGYSDPSSLSGRLQRGDKSVHIYGNSYQVKAQVHSIDFFSAHADYNELLQFLSCQNKQILKNLFLVHGDLAALENFKEVLESKEYPPVTIARKNQDYFI
jgi:metallo-beta-lactamase family protein